MRCLYLATERLILSAQPDFLPLKNNVSHNAHHHGSQDGAVDRDEVFVEAVAEEMRGAGT